MSKAKHAPLPPGTALGGYRLLRKLAAGGFGIVYLAVDAQGQQVAIKEYLPAALASREPGERQPRIDPDRRALYRLGLKSFFEEGRSLAQIEHSAVVGVRNFFRENDTVYLVMDYLEGATLLDYLLTARGRRRPKVLRESTIRSLFDEILRGLRIVHQHKMLHLDIKPGNIFITDDDRAVLIDFGAARQVLANEGRFLRPMHTPGFAAPEMYRRDSPMGPWTDIYAIGACLYACMLGAAPPTAAERLERLERAPPKGPALSAPSPGPVPDRPPGPLPDPLQDPLGARLEPLRGVYSDDLLEQVAWCLALDPLARPQSVFSLQKELSRDGPRRYSRLPLRRRLRLAWRQVVSRLAEPW